MVTKDQRAEFLTKTVPVCVSAARRHSYMYTFFISIYCFWGLNNIIITIFLISSPSYGLSSCYYATLLAGSGLNPSYMIGISV